MTEPIDQLCIDTIRGLSMDAIQAANSGHPGLPLGMAPAAFVLYADVMKHDPADVDWPDRDRFVLSAGHGSMLLYAALHLAGYDLSLEDIKHFRKWDSRTPGHPEREHHQGGWRTPGVEVTTGPLGQGFANGVGMAIAEQHLRHTFGEEVQDHHIYAIVSDGDLMEGVASEAASMAGQLGLGKLVYLYDDNDISLDGPTSLSFDSEDVSKRFEAYGWHVLDVADANDVDALREALAAGKAETGRPTLIHVHSIIGYPSPNKQGTSGAHGSPLGDEEVRLTKEAMGWDPDKTFFVPDGVYERFGAGGRKGAEVRSAWQERLQAMKQDAAKAELWDKAWVGEALPGVGEALAPGKIDWGKPALASRAAGKLAMAAFDSFVPTMVGGAADLSGSTNTIFPGGDAERLTRDNVGRNVFFGVREHAMGAAVNGMAAHGGIVRPYGSTFLQFADYMRGSIRLSALMQLKVAWVFTHDSVALGEDGPTHQPVEHLAALRAIPGLTVLRPGDPMETAEAWRVILEELDGPAVLVLSRQNLPVQTDAPVVGGVGKGAYVIRKTEEPPQAVLVGTGGELHTALEAADLLEAEGLKVQVVSMPSWELYDAQDEGYKQSVLPLGVPKVSIEAGIAMGWAKYVDASVSIERFGASAEGTEVLERLGITPAAAAAKVKALIG
ncbi:MAG: tkt [Solirubrobacterales bacterium]|nr:tkt [Solirubrobacterales bacterium]